ncbi:MAG: TonB-dependent receptor [Sphingomonadaceae bacterium]
MSVGSLAWTMPVAAQSAGNAPNEASDDMGDIVVTANKREQSLRDVGATVSVLGSADLANKKITDLQDIASAMPGLAYSTSENNTPVFTLRGVGFNEASLAAYPTVSVYIDEAPLPFSVLAIQGAFDLERIEVLKGPQGTLFGQNSTGGAINYIAAKPTADLRAGIDASYGRFNTKELNGFVSGPLSESLRFRVAGHFVRGDDWQKSYTRDDKLGDTEVYAGRAILDFDNGGAVRVSLSGTAWQDKSEPQAGQLVGILQQIPGVPLPQLQNYPFPNYSPRVADWTPTGQTYQGYLVGRQPNSNRRFWQTSLRGDIDVTDAIVLTSLTSYLEFRQRQNVDYDALSLVDTDTIGNNGKIRTIFQETRLASSGDSALKWVVGANIQHSKLREGNTIAFSDSSATPAFAGFFQNGYTSNTTRRDYAAFANAEYALTDVLTVKIGGRYTDSKTKTDICNFDSGDGFANAFFEFLGGIFSGGPVPPIAPGGCFTLNSQFMPALFEDTLKEDNFSWRAGLDYEVGPDTLIYSNVSRGYKAGAYPTVTAAFFPSYEPVKQESVTAYEAGIKWTSSDRSAAIDGAVFYYDYRDKQVRGKISDPVFGLLNALVNVPKSKLMGFELQSTLRPTRGLSFNAAVTYVDAEIRDYQGIDILGGVNDYSGATIPFTPKWSVNVSSEYKWDIGENLRPYVGAEIQLRSETTAYIGGESLAIPSTAESRSAPGVSRVMVMPGYALVNARAGVEWDDGKYNAFVWGKNVFNKYYVQNVIASYDTIYRLAGRPATYGITVGAKF